MRDQGELHLGWDDVLCRPIYRRCHLGSKFDAAKDASGPGVTKVLIEGKRQPRTATVSLSPKSEVSSAALPLGKYDTNHATDGPALLSAFLPARLRRRYGKKQSSSRLWDTLVRSNRTKVTTSYPGGHHSASVQAEQSFQNEEPIFESFSTKDFGISDAPTPNNENGFGSADDCYEELDSA